MINVALLSISTLSSIVDAGEIPGLPVMQPPSLQGDIQLQVGNDFFSVFKNRDDFRTQQLSLSGYITDSWLVVIDQSMLTARGPQHDQPDPPGTEGRLDQFSLSVAYRSYFNKTQSNIDQLLFGMGFRSVGNFSVVRIQNGAHRLLKESLINLPYVETERTDAVLWLRASKQRYFKDAFNDSKWQPGYWLDGSILQSSDGQSDGTIGAYGLLNYNDWNLWVGLRGDWREGYDRDIVQQLTADNESGVALAAGFSIGPIRLESVEGIGNNDNSFGRLVLTATRDSAVNPNSNSSFFAYQFSMLTPKIAMQTQFRWSASNWYYANKVRYSLVLDYRNATPAINNTATQFNISKQATVGVEASLINSSLKNWMQPYLMLGIGERSEYIEGQGSLAGKRSEELSSNVIAGDIGVRFFMAGKKNSWLIQLQLGLTAWYP
ncbi:MAG: hypothetical protein ACC653_08035, partial [Gammaproteobacteria bacterium]